MSENKPNILFVLGITAALSICFTLVLNVAFHGAVPVVRLERGELRMSDFAYHLLLVRQYWFGGMANIYLYSDQLSAIQRTYGYDIVHAMPVGVSPAALFLWYPFALVARSHFELACALWSGLSLGLLCTGLLLVFGERRRLFGSSRSVIFLAAAAAIGFSFTALSAVFLGQTSAFAAGAFLLLFSCCALGCPIGWPRLLLIAVAASFKAPYLLAAGGILLAYRRKELLPFLLLIVGIALASLLSFGSGTVSSYFDSQRIYAWNEIPEHYRDSIVPQTVNTLGTALLPVLGWQPARQAATVISMIAYALLGLLALGVSRSQALRHVVRPELVSMLLLAVFLCLAPYAGAYEDLLFLPLIAFGLSSAAPHPEESPRFMLLTAAVYFAVLFLLMNKNTAGGSVEPGILWVLKLAPVQLLFSTRAGKRSAAHE